MSACERDTESNLAPASVKPVNKNTIFSIAVLPDTQGYSQFFPEIWQSQTRWLADNKDALHLQPVIHLGDLVEGSWLPEQWQVARDTMSTLADADVPFVIAPGNHDYGELYESRNSRDRSTLLHQYFPPSLFQDMSSFGGFYPEAGRVDSSYHTFEAAGESWLILALEFGPRDSVLQWANEVVANHPDHLVIVATHAYLYSDNTRLEWGNPEQMWNPHDYGVHDSAEGTNDGQEIWDALISQHVNIVSVIGGHILHDGLGYAVSEGKRPVHEMLVNYQMNEYAGAGYLRILEFHTDEKIVKARTYSPWTDEYKMDADNQFEFSYLSDKSAIR